MRVLVLGYGNTVRQDDGVGWRAAEHLAARALPAGATVRALHQLAPELAGDVRDADAVLFVDAARDGVPGEVRVRAVAADARDGGFTHQLTPAALLRLAREVTGAAPAAFEVSVGGAAFDLGEELSPAVAAAFPRLVAAVLAKLEELSQSARSGQDTRGVQVVRDGESARIHLAV